MQPTNATNETPENALGIHHAGFLVSDLARALAFYEGIIGLSRLPRPDLPYPGAWLAVGAQQLHLMRLESPDPLERPPHGGRDRHLALRFRSIEPIAQALDAASWSYTRSRSGRAALFCRDPDGNTLECLAVSNEDA